MSEQGSTPEPRLRLLHVTVQPVVVWDDGVSLKAGPQLGTSTVALGDLDEFPAQLRRELDALAERLADEVEVRESSS